MEREKKVWCIRSEFGIYANQFINGGFAGIDYGISKDLSEVNNKDHMVKIYKECHPDESSVYVIGQQVGQISRFLFEIQDGDYLITPSSNTEKLHYGKVTGKNYWFQSDNNDGCPYRHRREVLWSKDTLNRSTLSVPMQNTIRSSLTVFSVPQVDEFLSAIKAEGYVKKNKIETYDPYESVLEQILELHDKEFEILVGHLLTALGFEESEVTGKVGDGGVDVTGILNVANLAKIKIYVQAKRYKRGAKISANVVKQLRTAIPQNSQGAFITTADYQSAAADIASEEGFPRIGLINGHQLVDLLIEHWHDIPEEFRDRLGLRIGLIKI